MAKDLQSLVDATRRLSQPRPESDSPDRRRRGERSMRTIRQLGGLPTPRIVEPEQLEEPPKNDIFTDFTLFGQRVSSLVADAKAKQNSTRHCTPYAGTAPCEVVRRRRRAHGAGSPEESYGGSTTDTASGKLVGAGIALLAVLALAVAVVSAPERTTRSRPLVRQPLPSTPPAEAAPVRLPEVIAGGPLIDDVSFD